MRDGKPVLGDFYGGEGGAGVGYQRAGFYVIGVDNRPQPRYPCDEFVQADALDLLADPQFMAQLDAAHASPPCQARSRATPAAARHRHPNLIGPTRARLQGSGLPWVIENVPAVGGEYLRPDLKLCGCLFGMPPELRRERWFETSPPLFDLRAPCAHTKSSVSINRRGGRYNGPGPMHDRYIPLAECQRLMGVEWMSQNGLGEAIPPVYTEYIGGLLMAQLRPAGAEHPAPLPPTRVAG